MIINAKYTKKNETERYFFNAVDFFVKKKRLTEPVNLFSVFRFTSLSVGEPKVTSLWSVRASPFGVPFKRFP